MPHGYEVLRDKFIRDGLAEKVAKTKAAKIYNSRHPRQPVTNKKD